MNSAIAKNYYRTSEGKGNANVKKTSKYIRAEEKCWCCVFGQGLRGFLVLARGFCGRQCTRSCARILRGFILREIEF